MRRRAGLILVCALVLPFAAAAEDEDSLVDADPFTLPPAKQEARVYEILVAAGFTDGLPQAVENARLDAHFRILEQVRGKGIAWGKELMDTLGKHYDAHELESRLEAALMKEVRVYCLDATSSGIVRAYAKFRVYEVVRKTIREKDWDRLEYVVRADAACVGARRAFRGLCGDCRLRLGLR